VRREQLKGVAPKGLASERVVTECMSAFIEQALRVAHILGINALVQRVGSEGDHRSGCDGTANSGDNHGSELRQSLLICRVSAMQNAHA